jgi:hypothetical protein
MKGSRVPRRKLTLSVDSSLLDKAKLHAAESGETLSRDSREGRV